MNRGYLIAFEGLDGSGKSTQLGHAADWLRGRGVDVIETREPTDGPQGRQIRQMARSGELVAPEKELAWFLEDRREHVADVIEPALAAGRWVLTDRYYLSNVAYQGARGLDPKEILARNEAEFPKPDLVLLFELSAEAGLARVALRGGIAEPAFEKADFLARAAAIFAELELDCLERVFADGSVEEVAARVRAALNARMPVPAQT